MIGDSNDKNNFPHKLLLTGRQVSRLRKAIANNLSVNIKLSKTYKIVPLGELLGHFSGMPFFFYIQENQAQNLRKNYGKIKAL